MSKKQIALAGLLEGIHGNSSRHPANKTDKKIRNEIVSLKKSNKYRDYNFTHFKEALLEFEKIGFKAKVEEYTMK